MSVLASQGLNLRDVKKIATIDLKRDEAGLLEFAASCQTEICFYSSEELLTVPGIFSESAFVEKTTGVGNVCERAAVLTAGKDASRSGCEKAGGLRRNSRSGCLQKDG